MAYEFNDTYLKPFSDNKLEYDYQNHWYLINPQYIINTYGELPSDPQVWKQMQYQLTNNVYRYIYRFKTGREDHDHIEWELAYNQRFREVIAYALLEQYAYATTSSGDILQLQHGVDINNQKTVEEGVLRKELVISTFAQESMLQNGMLESGFRTNFDYENLYSKRGVDY